MPLLNQAIFLPNEVPTGLDATDNVYYCELTGEIFCDYDEYFNRRIQLDTELWSCKITGKSSMTFEEAVTSEKEAIDLLKKIDRRLIRAVLYLFSKAPGRTSFQKLVHEIFIEVKDRPFLGEKLSFNKRKYKLVTMKYENSDKEKTPKKPDSDQENKSPNKKKKENSGFIKNYEYVLEAINDKGDITTKKMKSAELSIAGARQNFNKVVLQYLIKHHADQKVLDKSWEIKSSSMKKFKIGECEWSELFNGEEPTFEKLFPKPIKQKVEKRRSAEVLKETQKGKSLKDEKEKLKRLELEKIQKSLEKAKKIKDLAILRAEANKKLIEANRDWLRVRPDETLDNLCKSVLPAPLAITTCIPTELVGGAIQILEFHKLFSEAFGSILFCGSLKNLTLADMENILFEQITNGLFCDILLFFMQALRYCYENEFVESGNKRSSCPISNVNLMGATDAELEEYDGDMKLWPTGPSFDAEGVCDRSSMVAKWGLKTLGNLVMDFQVDEVTITEVLRLMILSSGAQATPEINSYRQSYRGGWSNEEDPFLQSFQNPRKVKILKKLEIDSVYNLKAEERLELLLLLSDGVLSQPDGRQVIDDADDEIKAIRSEVNEIHKSERERKVKHKATIAAIQAARKELAEAAAAAVAAAKAESLETDAPGTEASGTEASGEASAEIVRSTRNSIQNDNCMESKDEELQIAESKNTQEEIDHATTLDDCRIRSNNMFIKFRSLFLGYDRFYRKYWLMSGVPGILVEIPDHCPPPTTGDSWDIFKLEEFKNRPELKDFLPEEASELTHQINGDAPKQNGDAKIKEESKPETNGDIKPETNGDAKPLTNGASARVNDSRVLEENGEKMDTDEVEEDEKVDLEKIENSQKWSFQPKSENKWWTYPTREVVTELTQNLNRRGEREKPLRENILKYIDSMNFTSKFSFTNDAKIAGKSADAVDPYAHALLACRDYILDLEERINRANFGDAWADETERQQWREFWTYREFRNDLDFEKMIDPKTTHVKWLSDSLKLKTKSAWCRTPVYECKYPIYLINSNKELEMEESVLEERLKEVKNLAASAVLLARAVIYKSKDVALCRPMFNNVKTSISKKKTKDWLNQLNWQYANWESSILSCKTGSALYLHLVHLDECIDWAQSPENIRCSVCRKKKDAEKMLICDDCEKAYHTYCLKPKIKTIPTGDWFCKNCKSKHVEESPKKRRRKTNVTLDSDDEDFPQLKRRNTRKVDYTD